MIGFFIGRDVEERISELTKKRDLILKNIDKHCTQSLRLMRRRIEEIQNSDTYLIHVDKEQCVATIRSLEADLTYLDANKVLEPKFIRVKREELERFRRFVLNYNMRARILFEKYLLKKFAYPF